MAKKQVKKPWPDASKEIMAHVPENVPAPEPERILKHMEDKDFGSVVRSIKNAGVDRVRVLHHALKAASIRLGLGEKPNLRKAVKGLPDGSDHWDAQSLVAWMDKITPKDKEAVAQVAALYATTSVRVEG